MEGNVTSSGSGKEDRDNEDEEAEEERRKGGTVDDFGVDWRPILLSLATLTQMHYTTCLSFGSSWSLPPSWSACHPHTWALLRRFIIATGRLCSL